MIPPLQPVEGRFVRPFVFSFRNGGSLFQSGFGFLVGVLFIRFQREVLELDPLPPPDLLELEASSLSDTSSSLFFSDFSVLSSEFS